MSTWIQDNWLTVVAMFFALGALAPIPYFAYFQLMNWIVMGAALMIAWHAFKLDTLLIAWVFVLVAVVFNPIAPIYLQADVWRIADIVVAALFALSLFLFRKKS